MQAVQLSHEELLLLIGLLRLPMPLAMGENPTEGYTEQTIGAALTSAMSSMLARGLLQRPPTESETPVLPDEVQELITTSALAERCLMVAARQNQLNTAIHFNLRGSTCVVHSSPLERVHRLEWLSENTTIVEQLMGLIMPHPPVGAPIQLSVKADAFSLAIDAAAVGQSQGAYNLLLAAGAPPETADTLVGRLGKEVARYALVAFRNLQAPQPQAESLVVLQGASETWLARESTAEGEYIVLQTVTPVDLRTTLERMVEVMNRPA